MTTRAATATIKGYYYQFDSSIQQLLALASDDDSITVEGIEDIDVESASSTTAVQCKYLSKPKYIPSAVREPISLMLQHYATNTSAGLSYTLYAHFVDEIGGTDRSIDLEELKELLTYTEDKKARCFYRENGISDAQMKAFLKKFRLTFGKEFEKQQKEVIGALKAAFKCSEFEADTVLYNNALRVVVDMAKEQKLSKRKISKRDFLRAINVKERLFNEWYILLRTKTEYLRRLRTNLKTSNVLMPSRTKYIHIGKDVLAAQAELQIVTFVMALKDAFYIPGKSFKDAKPPCLIIDADQNELNALKKHLISKSFPFNDGWEALSFSPEIFNETPVTNLNRAGNKLARSSYWVKVISTDAFLRHAGEIKEPDTLLSYSQTPLAYRPSARCHVSDIKYCETLQDIIFTLK